MSRQHLDWTCSQAQIALLEYANVQQVCPPGVYVSTTPQCPSVWQGVYFVRRGTYCLAVLRFHVVLPPEFPEKAPALTFTSELFHPLVVPFSTYTFSNASPPRRPQKAGDEQRLGPGSLNLGFGFPEWFRRRRDEAAAAEQQQSPASAVASSDGGIGFSDDEYGQDTPSKKPPGAAATMTQIKGLTGAPRRLMFMPPPAVDALEYSSTRSYPGMAAVLEYMVQAFEDDEFLDTVGVDDAANSGAFHAWRAYRARVRQIEEAKRLREKHAKKAAAAANGSNGDANDSAQSGASTPRNGGNANRIGITSVTPGKLGSRLRGSTPERRDPGQWDWNGVWLERVRKCVKDSTSDAKLYKEHVGLPPHGRDEEPPIEMIRFLDLEKDDVRLIRENLRFAQREAAAARLDVKTNEKAPRKPKLPEEVPT